MRRVRSRVADVRDTSEVNHFLGIKSGWRLIAIKLIAAYWQRGLIIKINVVFFSAVNIKGF